jgi:hypothetical protein
VFGLPCFRFDWQFIANVQGNHDGASSGPRDRSSQADQHTDPISNTITDEYAYTDQYAGAVKDADSNTATYIDD